MSNLFKYFSLAVSIVNAIKNDPALWSAITELWNAIPHTPPATGNGQPTMMAHLEAHDQRKFDALQSTFAANTELHTLMRSTEPDHAATAAFDIGSLFSIFTQLLPLIIQLLPKKTAST